MSVTPLVRRWAVGWLNGRDEQACDTALAPAYRLRIGSVQLEGRDEYREATLGQLRNYPGLVLTVHDILVSEDQALVFFTEHGAAQHRSGAVAAWRGIVIHQQRGGQIVESWAEEDYASRSMQLASGIANPILPPAPAPWDSVPETASTAAEDRVRNWIQAGFPAASDISVNDDDAPTFSEALPTPIAVDIDTLFSAGRAVGVHATAHYSGGIDLGIAGLVRVSEDGQLSGHIVTDSAGLQRQRVRLHGAPA